MPTQSRRRLVCSLLAAAAGAGCTLDPSDAAAQQSLDPARTILAERGAIIAPNGIDTAEAVPIGGLEQWITVRGRDLDNPVLLFLHGGPGFPSMPVAWSFQTPWEEYFTVVQWDQRGAGRTFAANDSAAVAPTLTVERMIADAEEMVLHLRRRYGKEKIVLAGHSWGSVLGLELARRHPEWFHAYVGMSQAVDVPANEREGYDSLVARATRAGDTEALAELQALAPYPEADGAIPVAELYTQRKWLRRYDGYTWREEDDHYYDLVRLSPDYGDAEVAAFGPGIAFSFEALWPQFTTKDFWDVTELKLPVILMHGAHDLTVSYTLAERWFDRLRAPSKKFIRFDQSAHMIMMEEPGKTFLHLVQDVLPVVHGGRSPESRALRE